MSNTSIDLGSLGEELATGHLRRDGLKILDRNWHCKTGELDIIAVEHNVTVFCEVKTRRSLRFGTPMQAIDEAKATRLHKLAAEWRRSMHRRVGKRRFDVVCIVIRSSNEAVIEHRRGAL